MASAERADPQARGDHRGPRVVRDRVAVDRDAHLVEAVLGLLAVQLGVAQVHQDQVHVRAAGQDGDAGLGHVRLHQTLGEDLRALEGALLALLELLARGDLEGDRLGRDDVLQRAALLPGEDRRVDLLGQLGRREDHTTARTAQRLVRGGGDDVRVRHRRGVQPGGDEAREVGHVDHQVCADLVGDPAEGREVQLPRVGGPAGDDQLRPVLLGEALDLLHVDQVGLLVDVVGDHVVELAGEVDLHAVGQVPAVGEVQTQDGVAGVEQREHRGRVGLRAGVRLDVGVLGTEERLDPVDRDLLDDVDVLAAAVVAAARVALGVLVGEDRALGLHDRDRSEVLRGDHLEGGLLAVEFGVDCGGDVGVELMEGAVQQRHEFFLDFLGRGGVSLR
ncbi:hypothetical protein GCM10020000_24360 [Streptomyces olivoverticillatus]